MSDPPLLEVRDLEVAYGHVQAVRGISLSVRKGQIVTLIGPNGAGKSSTLNAIAGLLKPKRGAVLLEGRDLAGVPAHRAARDGIVLVPEGRAILQRMTVEENLRLAAEMLPARGERAQDKPASAPRVQDQIDEQLRNFPSLERRRALPAGQMSGGEQQMLAVARALLQKPRILLLDEPSMGLAPILVAQIFALLEQINGAGTTLLLVESRTTPTSSSAAPSRFPDLPPIWPAIHASRPPISAGTWRFDAKSTPNQARSFRRSAARSSGQAPGAPRTAGCLRRMPTVTDTGISRFRPPQRYTRFARACPAWGGTSRGSPGLLVAPSNNGVQRTVEDAPRPCL